MSDVQRSDLDATGGAFPAPGPEGFRPPIEVVVAHPDATVRAALVAELDAPGITVVGETGDGTAAVALIRERVPDVAVLATDLPGTDGVGACRDLRVDLPVARVLLVTDEDDEDALGGLRAGAYGCWLRTAPQLPLVDAVRGTMRRESLPTAGWAAHLLASYADLADTEDERIVPVPHLSGTEFELLERIAEGVPLADIAGEYEVTVHMVRLHVGYAIIKLYRALADERQMQSLRA